MAQAEIDEQLRRLRAAAERIAAEDVPELVAEARVQARDLVRELLVEALADAMVERVHTQLTPERGDSWLTRRAGNRRQGSQERAARDAEVPAPPRPADPPQRGLQARRPEDQPRPEDQRRREDPRRRESPAATEVGLYVYCVVASDAVLPPRLTGIDPAHQPRLLVHGAVAAVLSAVPLEDFEEKRLREHLSDIAWVERTARAHEQALEAVAAVTTTVPMRMCSIYRDTAGVRKMLARESVALEEALAHLEGKSEWGVKVFAGDQRHQRGAEQSKLDRSDSQDEDQLEAEQPTSGTDYMRRRQSEREKRWNVDEELHEAAVVIHEVLTGAAADALTVPLQRPEVSGHAGQMLLNGVYLVEAEHEEAFLALIDRLRSDYEAFGLEIEPTGPWPAYNFVPGAIGAAW